MKERFKCPRCRDYFPKGGRFCPNCGIEARTLWRWEILITLPTLLLGGTWYVIRGVVDENWLYIIFGGLLLIGWTLCVVYLLLWFRWTRPVDSDTTLASEGESSQL